MKKTLALLLALGMLVLMLTGCQVNREKDMAQIVLQVGDVTYTKQQVYDTVTDYFTSMGYSIDLMDETMEESTREQMDAMLEDYLDYLMQMEVAAIIVDRDMPLSEEEIAEADASVDQYVEFVKAYMLTEDEDPEAAEENAQAEGEDIDAQVDAFFLENTGMTLQEYREEVYKQVKLEKLGNALAKDVTASDEQVKARYETDLQSQKEAAITGETYYESVVTGDSDLIGAYTLHKASGYQLVKHILFTFTEEQQDELEALQETIDDEKSTKSDAETAKSEAEAAKLTAEDAGDTEEAAAQQKIIDDKDAIISTQSARIETLQNQYFARRDELAAGNVAKAQDLVARLKAGEDFDTLLAEYGEDPGMKQGASSITGYLISPTGYGFDETFVDAAQQLTEAGQISDPVVSDFGVHIVKLLYGTDEADLPYDLVKSIVQPLADEDAQQTAVDEGIQKYADELGVKVYPDRIKFVK